MRTRNWSIRAKVISLLMIPLVTLVGMWALATYVTIGPGLDLLRAQTRLDAIERPGAALLAEVQAERKLSVTYLAGGRKNASTLTDQRLRTDAAIDTFHRMAGEDAREASSDLTVSRLDDVFARLGSIGRIRGGVDRGDVDRDGTFRDYTDVADSIFQVFETLPTIADEGIARESAMIVDLGRAHEVLAREDAVLSAAIAAGAFTAADLSQALQLIGAQRFLYADTVPELDAAERDDYALLAATDPFKQLTAMENRVIAEGRPGSRVPVDPANWTAAYEKVTQDLSELELRAAAGLVNRSGPAALGILARIGVAGVAGLIAVIATMMVSIRIGRRLLKRLAGLRQAALELAVDRLPRVMSRLRRGDTVDVDHEAPPLPYGKDEIGQVGHAFNELQRTAVNAAIEEANVRRGLNEVFLNIARRSQTLLHRQLSILDKMERRADDPVELEDLFRVDHLSTRMRRHAEDLVILAGSAPGRGWRNPVPIVDVLRGAVSEVEEYARVTIRPMPDLAVAGRAVGDIIHLLAELIENATSFSPPHTRVHVGGEKVAHGFAVEVEDRGLGMTPAALADSNQRLADPPDFDPANSAQLGLFVVARLAARHGVKVQLRSSPYGGITAVALLPEPLIVADTGEFAGWSGHRAREAVALPAAPHSHAPSPNGSARRTHWELPTGQRPAIAATPSPDSSDPHSLRSSLADARYDAHSDPHSLRSSLADARYDAHSLTATAMPTAPRHAEVIEASPGTEALPRRVRQRNLAPQLRGEPPIAATADVAAPAPSSRSPEEMRAMMSSFQAGTARGRRDADEATEDATSSRPERDQT
jgi:signal transduction histidine kinase